MKCELARCLNRENAFKMSLEEKEKELSKLQKQFESNETMKILNNREAKKPGGNVQDHIQKIEEQNQFLNAEIFKFSRKLQLEQFKNHSKNINIQEIQGEVDQLKRDYVFLLQSCIRLTCTEGPESMELYLYGEKRHKSRVFELLEEARKTNGSLPSLEGITTSLCHVDSLGFKHLFVDKSLILHYVCRQLHHHYSKQLRSHDRHIAAWNVYLRCYGENLQSTVELKSLIRNGIPCQLRSRVWCRLYTLRVQDIKESKGPNYFENLCNMATESSEVLEQHKRQISLDLLRTMPNNINFCDRNAEGIKKMQDVLNAFCLHNPKLGYCQGMNFLVGMMLLFMDTENAFWCLVAIVERYFTPSYFDQNLIGAQADQEVLKDLLKTKLPRLSSHMAALDIELCTITLNWFLSIFIDSVPLETLLRIWDCFLLEGPKVLFRFSLAILLLQEEAILAKHDTVSIMRQLKAAAKLCFDVEGLVKAAFEDLEPFPKRQEISSKQAFYYKVLLERARKKERELQALRERERIMTQVELEGPHNHLIECAGVWGKDKVWICHGHHHGSRVSMVNCQENIMYRLHIEFESRVMCMHAPNDDTMLFGTFSHFVHAYHTISRKKMWEICLNSSVLSLCSHQRDGVKQVFAGLADGTLAVVENVQGRMPKPEVFYVVIGPSPVTCVQLVGRRLWCACGSNVIILSARTLDLLDQFQTSSNGLDYIYRMVSGEQGVWITLRGSSILQLWDPHGLTCRLLYDVRDDYCTRSMKIDEAYTNHARITSVLPFDSSILVGTADGTLVIYDVIARKSPSPSVPASPRPQPPQPEPDQTNAKQIQERLEKLFIEQQLQEAKEGASAGHDISQNACSDSSLASSFKDVSEGPLSGEASSEVNNETVPPTGYSRILVPGNRLEDMQEEEEEEEPVLGTTDTGVAKHRDDISEKINIICDRSIAPYSKGYRKMSFTLTTPIVEEPSNGLGEESPEGNQDSKEKETTNRDKQMNEVSADASENKGRSFSSEEDRNFSEESSHTQACHEPSSDSLLDSSSTVSSSSLPSRNPNAQDPANQGSNVNINEEPTVTDKTGFSSDNPTDSGRCNETDKEQIDLSQPTPRDQRSDSLTYVKPIKTDYSEGPYNFSRRASAYPTPEACYTTEGGSSMFQDFKSAGYKLLEASRRFQSLSAEDLPTWIAQEKPEPVISEKGDITFRYKKSRLPMVKAFIRREADDLAKFLKSSSSMERLALEADQEKRSKNFDNMKPKSSGQACPSICVMELSPDAKPKGTPVVPTIISTGVERPLSLESSGGSQVLRSCSLAPPDRVPTPTAIEITVEATSDTTSQEADKSTGDQQFDSRRSSASVHSMQDDIPYIMANDDDFLSTAQFNDLLQLQDWTRTSRKGSDTASNVSFGSAEVPFAFELILKEKIKISDKPIRSLLQASCNEEPIIISCAGYYGDDEAVLKWNKEGEEKLWTNDPIIEVCPYTHTIKPSPYARSRLPRRASIATTSLSGSCDVDGTFGGRSARSSSSPAASAGILVESGLAKVQHLLSRVSDRT